MKLKIQGKILLSFILIILSSFLIFNISIQKNIKSHFNQYCERESCSMDENESRHGQNKGMLNANQSSFLESVQSSLLWTSLGTLLVALLMSILLSDRMTRPIREMIKTTKEIANGNYSKRLNLKGNDEIADLGNSLNEMAQSLNKIEQLRKDLITNFSHEMATPLTTINGYLEAIEDGLVEDCNQKMKIMTTIKEETNRLMSMIKDLRDLSQIESGHFKIHLSPVSLYPMMEKIVHSMDLLFAEKKIHINLSCMGESPTILADQIRFPQIILNLLDNAYNYTPMGGKVTITISSTKTSAEVTIQDSGIGISPLDIPHIFERFYRTEASRSRKSGGSGIGLSIVQDLMNLHKGKITVESTLGKGTIFHLFFTIV